MKLVEFYAGMGTMRWSLERALESDAGASVTALASIDNSEVANAVYLANYPDENASGVLMRRNIEHLSSVETLDARFGGADVWTLSPPCPIGASATRCGISMPLSKPMKPMHTPAR